MEFVCQHTCCCKAAAAARNVYSEHVLVSLFSCLGHMQFAAGSPSRQINQLGGRRVFLSAARRLQQVVSL
jgi:hypothetical protein